MLEDIRNQFRRLVALYEAQRGRADALEEELRREREVSRSCREQIAALEKQMSSSTLAQAFLSPGTDTAAAKERIDKLVREIDKCISLLEKK